MADNQIIVVRDPNHLELIVSLLHNVSRKVISIPIFLKVGFLKDHKELDGTEAF